MLMKPTFRVSVFGNVVKKFKIESFQVAQFALLI